MSDTLERYNPTLYDLETELLEVLDALQEAQETGEEPPEGVEEMIAEYVTSAVAKRDRCAQFLLHLEATEQAIAAEEVRLRSRRALIAQARARFEGYILSVMEQIGSKELRGQIHAFKVRQNPPAVQIDPGAEIPQALMRQKPPPPPEPDKAAIQKRLKGGVEIPGCRIVTKHRLVVE